MDCLAEKGKPESKRHKPEATSFDVAMRRGNPHLPPLPSSILGDVVSERAKFPSHSTAHPKDRRTIIAAGARRLERTSIAFTHRLHSPQKGAMIAFIVSALALSDPPLPRQNTLARRAVLLGAPAAMVLGPAAAKADDLLETAGNFVQILKPFYKGK